MKDVPDASERHLFFVPEWDFNLYPASIMCVAENMRCDPVAGVRDERTEATKRAKNMVVIPKADFVHTVTSKVTYTCIPSR